MEKNVVPNKANYLNSPASKSLEYFRCEVFLKKTPVIMQKVCNVFLYLGSCDYIVRNTNNNLNGINAKSSGIYIESVDETNDFTLITIYFVACHFRQILNEKKSTRRKEKIVKFLM